MLKQNSYLEIKKGDRVYQLHCAGDSTWGEVFDVLSEMRAHTVKRIQEQIPAESAKEPECLPQQ